MKAKTKISRAKGTSDPINPITPITRVPNVESSKIKPNRRILLQGLLFATFNSAYKSRKSQYAEEMKVYQEEEGY